MTFYEALTLARKAIQEAQECPVHLRSLQAGVCFLCLENLLACYIQEANRG
jgi:hypothetical protein